MKILMVCLGNICRSPLAEGILKSKLPESFQVDSAGTIAMHEGQHPDKRSVVVAQTHGIDISRQRSRPIKPKDLETFNKIFCMDLHNFQDVVSMAETEAQRGKIRLILEEAGNFGETNEVPDPYYGDIEDFEKVFRLLDSACEIIAQQLKSNI